jgi:hypothetical protein
MFTVMFFLSNYTFIAAVLDDPRHASLTSPSPSPDYLQHGDSVATLAGKGRVRMYTREYEKEAAQSGGMGKGFEQEKADLIKAARGGDRVKTFLESVGADTGMLDAGLESDRTDGNAHSRNAEDRGLGRGHEGDREAHRGKDKDRDAGRKRSRSNSAGGW